MASSNRLKTTEQPHRCSSIPHAHHKLSAEYRQKRRLRIQNRFAGCVLSCTNTSRQQEVPLFCLRKQGISISSTFLQVIQFLALWSQLDQERASLPIARACQMSSQTVLSFREVSQFMGSLNWASGLIPMG